MKIIWCLQPETCQIQKCDGSVQQTTEEQETEMKSSRGKDRLTDSPVRLAVVVSAHLSPLSQPSDLATSGHGS